MSTQSNLQLNGAQVRGAFRTAVFEAIPIMPATLTGSEIAAKVMADNPDAGFLASSVSATLSILVTRKKVKQMKGDGKVTCSNGQRANVEIESHGGGFTIGKSDILNGEGTFSEVKDMSEIFGTYAQAEAHGGATKGGAAQVMTKGEISLAIAGAGRGWDVGVSLGGFTIEKK